MLPITFDLGQRTAWCCSGCHLNIMELGKELSLTQTLVLLPMSELETLKEDLQEIKQLFLKKQENAFRNSWVESEEARRQLGVCQRTWQRMRDDRVIPFSQFGRKIYVKQADIESFLNSKQIPNNEGRRNNK